MSVNIFFSNHFKHQLKKLQKKYPKIKYDLLDKLKLLNLEKEVSIGRSIYKIRIKSTDQNKGQSGGFRSYIYLYRKQDLLVPLCIYAKNDKESITENELQHHFDQSIQELIKKF